MSSWLARKLERNRKACLQIRNRRYPEAVWPGEIYLKSVCADKGDVVLEIGCGRRADMLRRVGDRFRLKLGLDPDAREPINGDGSIVLLSGDAAALPFPDESADVIAMANVAEHLCDPLAVFHEAARVLRPNGRFIILTVNQLFPFILAARLLPHRVCATINRIASGTAEEDTFPTFYRANSLPKLRSLGEAAGLEVIGLEYLPHHPTYLLFSPLVYRVGIVFEQIVRHTQSLAWLRHFLFSVFRKPSA